MRDVGATMPAGFVDGLRTMRRGETALPGLASIARPGESFDHALCFPLRDRKDQAIGAILFLDAGRAGRGMKM